MTKIGMFLSLVVAAVVITTVFRWLSDRVAGRRGAFGVDNSGDNVAPGASFSQKSQPDASIGESGGGDGD
jgi:hypothetical protein